MDGPAKPVRVDQRLGAPLPLELEFRDHTGKVVRLGEYFTDRPVIITPVYYRCPMLCNLVLEGLNNSLRDLRFEVGKEFDVVTVSFDARETSADAAKERETAVRHYRRAGAATGWHFLTGDQTSINTLMNALGFRFQWDAKSKQWAHGATIVVATPDGRISRYLFGVQYPARDLRLGLVESSKKSIGSPIDQFLLLCYSYDPATGRYNAVAMNTVRIAGGATVLGIAGFIFLMIRKERKPHV